MVFFQRFKIYTGLVVKAVDKRNGIEFYEIFISHVVFGQQNEMVQFSLYVARLDVKILRHIKFATDNGLYPRQFCKFIKLVGAVHVSVVGNRHGRHVFFFAEFKKPALRLDFFRFVPLSHKIDASGAVQQTVLRMDVQMNELPVSVPTAFGLILRHFFLFHCLSPYLLLR